MPGFEIFGDEERKEVQDVLDTGVLFRYGFDSVRKGHWKARTFETEAAHRLGIKHCYLCANGTAALNIALASCGLGAGDEVIVPPFTFIATIEAVMNIGAVPVFAEIDDTLCLDPDKIEQVLTNRTKAVLPVHMCGAMARIDEIKAFCDHKGLILIEDACQALGAALHGKYLGTFGHAGCFSFDAVKTVTCGEGGAVVTNQDDFYRMADAYADHGHDHLGNDRGLEEHEILGFNFRISELNAAVGLAQLRKLDMILEKQRSHKQMIQDALSSLPNIHLREIPDPDGDSATFFSFFLRDESIARDKVNALSAAGVDGCFYWYDNNWHYFKKWDHLKRLQTPGKLPIQVLENCPDYQKTVLPQSDHIMSKTISTQIKLSWTKEELSRRVDKMVEILKD